MATAKLGLAELATRINAHLERFERDRKINKIDPVYKTSAYYCAGAYYGGRGPTLSVTYVAYQGPTCLRITEAMNYLTWLDAGNVGRHWEARLEATVDNPPFDAPGEK